MSIRPNILFICTDQHRWDSLSFNNPDTPCLTPNLDELAGNAVIFDDAYTTCPVCTPARSSMQTGLYPSKTGMEANTFESGSRTHELADADYLLSRRLGRAGYTCAYTGKWHLGVGRNKEESMEGRSLLAEIPKGRMEIVPYEHYGTLPTDVGYIGDDFPGHGNGGWKFPQFQKYLADRGLKLEIKNTTGHKRPGDHSTCGEVLSPVESTIEYFLVERAIALMEECRKKEKPFFLNLNFWGPHEPYFAPTGTLDLYRNMPIAPWKSFDESPEGQPRFFNLIRRPEQGWDFFEDTLRHYYAVITHIDRQLGRLFEYIKREGLFDDTTIIFSADHGDSQGCHGGLENKSYGMYDDTTRIPLLIRPAHSTFREAVHCRRLVGTCDLYATILREAGFIPDDDYGYGDGRPLQPLLRNPESEWDDEIVTDGMGAFTIVVTQRMYRRGRYKYVFNLGDHDQLFDLQEDPAEMVNLAEDPDRAELLQDMKLGLSDWMEQHHDPIRDPFCKMNALKEWSGK